MSEMEIRRRSDSLEKGGELSTADIDTIATLHVSIGILLVFAVIDIVALMFYTTKRPCLYQKLMPDYQIIQLW